MAAPQSTVLSISMGGKRMCLMSLATQVVVRCSRPILCSKFTKNRLSAGLGSGLLGSLQRSPVPLSELRGHFATEKGGRGRKEKEGNEGKGVS